MIAFRAQIESICAKDRREKETNDMLIDVTLKPHDSLKNFIPICNALNEAPDNSSEKG